MNRLDARLWSGRRWSRGLRRLGFLGLLCFWRGFLRIRFLLWRRCLVGFRFGAFLAGRRLRRLRRFSRVGFRTSLRLGRYVLILPAFLAFRFCFRFGHRRFVLVGRRAFLWPRCLGRFGRFGRSEERRVGKECRSRWSP